MAFYKISVIYNLAASDSIKACECFHKSEEMLKASGLRDRDYEDGHLMKQADFCIGSNETFDSAAMKFAYNSSSFSIVDYFA